MSQHHATLFSVSLVCFSAVIGTTAFVPRSQPAFHPTVSNQMPFSLQPEPTRSAGTSLAAAGIVPSGENIDDDDDDDEEEEDNPDDDDPYTTFAASEFSDTVNKNKKTSGSSALLFQSEGFNEDGTPRTNVDWGGALGKLRQRVDDVESGKSQDPSWALFRTLSSQSPNQLIGNFVTTANPQVIQAMSSAVASLLGGLSSPASGMETLVKASGEKIGTLCFQLQMTGYMFRNAEYVLALKEVMNLKGSATVLDYKEAFDRLDSDNNGFIESDEVKELLDDVYGGKTPKYEVGTFLEFFDSNKDGKISWDEFEKGLGEATGSVAKQDAAQALLGAAFGQLGDDEEDDSIDVEPTVSGKIKVELEDGKIVEVEAREYIESLKREAQALKDAIRKEKFGENNSAIDIGAPQGFIPPGSGAPDEMDGNIADYIASRQGDVKTLTEGMSPEVVDTMKRLVSFVLEGGDSGKAGGKPLTEEEKAKMEMAIPGSALQQLALWQLVIGYRLRESEATGDYLKLLE